jgi:16S rRNA (cytosine967-C5)-methyltransferase
VNQGDRARELAARVIGRVLRSGAYSNVLVSTETAGEIPQVTSKVKALVFGVLRRLEILDEAIVEASKRSLDRFEPDLLDRLRVSVFEVMFGDLPTPIAVSSSVDSIRSTNPRAAGLANAILRRVAESGGGADPGIVLPSWLLERLDQAWGSSQRERFQVASGQDPGRVVRLRRPGSHEGLWPYGVVGAVDARPGPLPEDVVVQDGASIEVGNVVGAEPGMIVLDIAAAPGGKTLHLIDQMGGAGTVVAMDRHRRRTRNAAKRVPEAKWLVGDGSSPPFGAKFDRVLLDAPCSGLGTLRRRPEIGLRIQEESLAQLARLQRRLLETAVDLVAPGGRLVYSVCTVTPEETVEVVEPFPMRPADGVGEVRGKGRLLAPHLTGTDGMFISVLDG